MTPFTYDIISLEFTLTRLAKYLTSHSIAQYNTQHTHTGTQESKTTTAAEQVLKERRNEREQ